MPLKSIATLCQGINEFQNMVQIFGETVCNLGPSYGLLMCLLVLPSVTTKVSTNCLSLVDCWKCSKNLIGCYKSYHVLSKTKHTIELRRSWNRYLMVPLERLYLILGSLYPLTKCVADTSPYQLDGNLMTFPLLSSTLAHSSVLWIRETEKITSLEDSVNLHRLLIVIALLLTIFMSHNAYSAIYF